MDNKLEFLLLVIVLAIVVTGAVLLNTRDYITPAITQAQIGVSPAGDAARSISSFLTHALIVVVSLLIIIGACWYGYDLVSKRKATGWVGGPNARWKRREEQQPAGRGISRDDLLMIALLKSLGGGNNPNYSAPQLPSENDDNGPMEF